MEDWDLTDASQTRQFLGAQKELHRKRCNEDLEQAQRCCDVLITAQGDVQSGKLRCQDNCPDEVHRLFCLPGTSVKMEKVILETPPVVKTAGEHNFKTGQNVIITGLKVRAGAPIAVHNLVESLSRDHAVVWVDDCRFSVSSISKLPCEEDDAAEFLDLSEAEVALNVCCWGLGRSSISLSVLLAMSETASASGLGLVASKFYNGLCVSCDSLRNVADTTASHVGHTQRIMPPGTFADSLSWTHHCLRSVSDLKAPDVTQLFSHLWGRMVEKLQPETWKSGVAADFCAECFQPFGSAIDNAHKHHCRNCGRVVCDACSKDRKCVPWEGHFQAVRVCKPCVDVVEIKNLTLKQCDVLREQISLVQTGLYHPKRKGAGKGKPPPPPPKGKGKGKSQGPKAARGAEDLKPDREIGGAERDFVLVERPLNDFKATRSGAAWHNTQQSKEVLVLTVSMNGCKHHVEEIQHALENVTLEGAEHLESWFGKVDQIMPLEKKFSAQTLERLKAVPDEELSQLSEHERRLRRLLLPVDCLDLRWRTLRLLHELAEPHEQELYWKVLRPATAAIHALLSPSTEPPLELVPEVKNLVALFYELMEPKCETLPDLAARTQVGSGPQLYVKAWEAGTKHGVCNVKAVLDLLPILEDEKLCQLHVALDDFHTKRLELQSLVAAVAARGKTPALLVALEELEGVLQRVEEGLAATLASGRSLLSAFGVAGVSAGGSGVDPLGSGASNVARRVDETLKSLRTLLRGLKLSEPQMPRVPAPCGRRTLQSNVLEGSADGIAKSAKGKVLRKRRVTKATFVASDKVEAPETAPDAEIDELSEATVEEDDSLAPPRCDRAA